jgi:hypothetical protein
MVAGYSRFSQPCFFKGKSANSTQPTIIAYLPVSHMSFKKILQREFEVAFTKNPQPAWMRVLKYFLLGLFIYFLWGTKWLWIILVTLFALALAIHFWYRFKTKGWTKSYGAWKHENDKLKP